MLGVEADRRQDPAAQHADLAVEQEAPGEAGDHRRDEQRQHDQRAHHPAPGKRG
jgi:hypothetical protein